MSTLQREAVDAGAPHPSTSMALVPLPRAEAVRSIVPGEDGAAPHAHRYFYGMGYAALALIVLGIWMEPANGALGPVPFMLAAPLLGIGGLGVLIHVLYKPRMHKLRMGLGAVASVALTAAAGVPLHRAATEVHAHAAILRLQPLADELLRDGRVRTLALPSGTWIELNGFAGRMDTGDPSTNGSGLTLAAVLRRDGISRLDLLRMRRRLSQAGVSQVGAGDAYVAFPRPGPGFDLLYVRPGHAPPPPRTVVLETPIVLAKPLGGGWYLYERASAGE